MIPGNVPVDPNFPDSNITFGPPPGGEDWCGSLTVRLVCLEAPDGTVGPAGFLSEWWPTPEELELLNAGQPVRTHLVGKSFLGEAGLRPQMVWVKQPEEV
jgi:hypothetical protein